MQALDEKRKPLIAPVGSLVLEDHEPRNLRMLVYLALSTYTEVCGRWIALCCLTLEAFDDDVVT
jgi:hypothetical protein